MYVTFSIWIPSCIFPFTDVFGSTLLLFTVLLPVYFTSCRPPWSALPVFRSWLPFSQAFFSYSGFPLFSLFVQLSEIPICFQVYLALTFLYHIMNMCHSIMILYCYQCNVFYSKTASTYEPGIRRIRVYNDCFLLGLDITNTPVEILRFTILFFLLQLWTISFQRVVHELPIVHIRKMVNKNARPGYRPVRRFLYKYIGLIYV